MTTIQFELILETTSAIGATQRGIAGCSTVRAEQIAAKVRGKTGIIIKIKIEQKIELPPLAYDLTELQRDANRCLDFSASKTLEILQGLYERHKLVTYPRTDSRYISADIVPTLPSRLRAMGVGPYASLAAPLLQQRLNPGKRLVDDGKVSDHHAIIPTEQPLNLGILTADEKNLYSLVARRFLAVLYPPFAYDQIMLVTEAQGERFHSRGRLVKDLGWRAVTADASGRDDREKGDGDGMPEQNLTRQRQGDVKPVKSCQVEKKQTRPPRHYTEATLLSAMENPGKMIDDEDLREAIKKAGLGTPATRAEIIEKLINCFYIERRGKELLPTSKGVQLVKLVAPGLKTPELTARWEQSLAVVVSGGGDMKVFLGAIRKYTDSLVRGVQADTGSVYHRDATLGSNKGHSRAGTSKKKRVTRSRTTKV